MNPTERSAQMLSIRIKKLNDSGGWVEVRKATFSEGGSNYSPRYDSWPACRCPQHRDPVE